MARSRSRSRSRDRRHGGGSRPHRSRSRERQHSERSRERERGGRSRDGERHRHRSTERDDHSMRSNHGRSDSRERRRRSRSSSREHTRHSQQRTRSASPQQAAPQQAVTDKQAAKRQRLEAWRAKQQQQQQQQQQQPPAAAATSSRAANNADAPQPKVWMPWEEDAAAPAAVDAQAAGSAPEQPQQAAAATAWMPWEDPSLSASLPQPAEAPVPVAASAPVAPPAEQPEAKSWDYVPAGVAVKKAKAAAEDLQEMLAQADGKEEEDPLEAFMSAEILPEVTAREEAERRAKEAERLKLVKDIAEGRAKLPTVDDVSDEEETPDLELQIPTSKVKLLIGPGGTMIGEIQKKSKARVQVKKEEDELNIAFGAGPAGLAQAKAKAGAAARKTGPAPGSGAVASDVAGEDSDAEGDKDGANGSEPKRRMTTIMIFGEAKAIEIAVRMIDEAVSNKEQKAKQRQKEYERKRDAKKRERQLYHMRHARDYEALGLPMGASKADVKKAHRKLAVQWHPDKHPTDKEEATAKFQEIQKAYDSLMSTNEDDRVEQLEK